MVIYTLSSTDPKHYNRIQVKLPVEFASRFVNVCVTSLTSNCNIEVMNEDDYITFLIEDETFRVMMTPYSKLTTASLPYILQDIFNNNNINITASVSNLDTLILTCEKQFSIIDMSYNMKLITGFYSLKSSEYPIKSVAYQEEYSVIDRDNKPLTNFSAYDLNIKTNDTRPIQYTLTPPDAYGFNIQYKSENEEIARVENGLILGVTSGECVINIEVRNPDTLLTSAPDFTESITVRVVDGIKTTINNVSVPDNIILYTNETTTIYPVIDPVNADFYIDSWESDYPEVVSVVNGFISASSVGTAIITYRINNNTEEETQTIEKQIFIRVKSPIEVRTVYKVNSPAVGYMLSTPILYLLTSVGAPVFFNEMHNEDKMQCGTISMVLNNSYSSSFPIVAQQHEIITRTPLNFTSNINFWLVDANMREIKLLNPLYITVRVEPEDDTNNQVSVPNGQLMN